MALHDLFWIAVDPGAKTCSPKEGPKKLVNICAEKLVSDVLLVSRYCSKVPKSIHLLVFSTAIAKKRILSIKELMRYSPHETLELPVPDFLKPLCTISQIENSILAQELSDFTRISMTMLSEFFDLIKKSNTFSRLQTLDLGLFPLRSAALMQIHKFIFEEKAKIPLFTKAYNLKCTVFIANSADLHLLKLCSENSTSLGFRLDITGVYFYNNSFIDVELTKLLDTLSQSNLQLITFSFVDLIPNSSLFFSELKFFRFLKYLNLSYMTHFLSSDIDVKKLASGLAELTNLQRLVLKGINCSSLLSTILLDYCKKNYVQNCCFIHSGSLHYLDISSCRLANSDLEFLREMSITNSLKYLDISENSFHGKRAFEMLLFLKHSLRYLNVSSCFKYLIDYDDALMPFSVFIQLKYLNIKGLKISESSHHLLEHELQKMPNLEVIETSVPISLNGVTVF